MLQLSISIHALRVEGDSSCKISAVVSSISIHALRVEGDFRDLENVQGLY